MGLQFSYVTGVLELQAPDGCKASVLLKSVGNDNAAEYVWWLLVGRQGTDAFPVSFDCKGARFIRCDVPEDHVLSEQAVSTGAKAFQAGRVSTISVVETKVQGGPSSGNGDGGTGTINP
jgi:hypothetical protein